MRNGVILSALLLLLALAGRVTGQPDTAFVTAAKASAHKLYSSAVLEQSSLLVGTAYRETEYTSEQHPYFQADTLQAALIRYNGQEYSDVPMLCDMTGDRVIIQNPYLGRLMMLIPEKVSGFVLQGRIFQRLSGQGAEPGLYELLVDGGMAAYCRRTKSFQRTTIGNEREIYYIERARYYLRYDGRLALVSSQASMLRHLSNQKKTMKNFIHEQGLDFERNPEEALKAVVAHYNTLTRQP